MPEELLVVHCSPTLAGLKTASLFACNLDPARPDTRPVARFRFR